MAAARNAVIHLSRLPVLSYCTTSCIQCETQGREGKDNEGRDRKKGVMEGERVFHILK